MDTVPNEVIYSIYTFLDMLSASKFANTSAWVRQCVPKYMIEHRRKLSKCNEIIRNIKHEICKKEFYFRGHEMIGTCMVSRFDRSICKSTAEYSLREFNGVRSIYLYSSKILIPNIIYTWETLQIYSTTSREGYKQIEVGNNLKEYKKILSSDKVYMRQYRYQPKMIKNTNGILERVHADLRD
jgi:hypothetical protein